MMVNEHTIIASGSYNGPYTAIYTITSSDAPDVITVTIRLTDIAGNQTNNYFTFGEKSSPKIVSATPSATSSTAPTPIGDLQSQIMQLQSQISTIQGASSSTASSNANLPIYSYKFNNSLKVGSKGADVTALQQRLTADGFYSGPTSGSFGPLTEAAVKKYQAQHGIDQLGNVGPATRASLNK
jgi:murein L,D-transpeptidase YcbB/YkuD